jgi:hypothetical protein
MLKYYFVKAATAVQNAIVGALEACIRAVKWFF